MAAWSFLEQRATDWFLRIRAFHWRGRTFIQKNTWNSAFRLMSKRARIFNRTALTFSQKVLKEPPRVVLWILQMDVGSPPGGWSVLWSLFCCTNTEMHIMMDTAWLTAVYHLKAVRLRQTDQNTLLYCILIKKNIINVKILYLEFGEHYHSKSAISPWHRNWGLQYNCINN